MPTIQLNGQPRTLQASTLDTAIAELGLKPDRIAVERNGEIVRRPTWATTPVNEQDRLEIVHFVGGGV